MTWVGTVPFYSSYWTLRDKNAKASSVLKQIGRRVVAINLLIDNTTKESLHSFLRRIYESCLRFMLARAVGPNRDFGAMYHCCINKQISGFEPAVQWSTHSFFMTLYHSLEDLCCSDNLLILNILILF